MQTVLIILSTILVLISPVIYIRSIFKGKSKPHRTTRFVLLVIGLFSTAALVDTNFSAAFWLAAASTVQALAVFVLSFKRGMGGWSKLDIVCLVIASIGIVLWQVTKQPLVSLYASIVADLVGCVPSLVKTYKYPDTEIWEFYGIDTLASLLSIIATTERSFYTLSYPVYLLVFNAAVAILIKLRSQQLQTI